MASQPKFNRRRFVFRVLNTIAATGTGYILASCGSDSRAILGAAGGEGVNDIMIRQVGVLPRELINAGVEVTLHFREPTHKHALKISAEDLIALRRGLPLRLTTAKANGHVHSVVIDSSHTPSFAVKTTHAYIRDGRLPRAGVGVVSRKQILMGKPVTIAVAGDRLDVQSIELSTSDLCALRGGVAITVEIQDSSSNERRTLVFDPQFEPETSLGDGE